jgi:hypothetical protein
MGFDIIHPVCLDWSLLHCEVDRWRSKGFRSLSWYVFARFAAIYPEAKEKLTCIVHSVTALKLDDLSA